MYEKYVNFATVYAHPAIMAFRQRAKLYIHCKPMEAKKIWQDSEGRLVLWQRPNVWLVTWAIAEVAGRILQSGKASGAARWLGAGSLTIWALLEIFRGVNYFRRGLGLVVLLLTVFSILRVSL